MTLSPPPGYAPRVVLNAIELCHPDLQRAFPLVRMELLAAHFPVYVNETYRYDLRQQYLFGAGRTGYDLQCKGVPASLARPGEPRVTDAWSAATSAHGYTIIVNGKQIPASCAIDIVPIGADGKPWTDDDPWDDFIAAVEPIANRHGLRHFRNHANQLCDRPHLQCSAWSDLRHTLLPPSPPLAAA